MKGFLRWFKNSAKMKRWYIVILAGIALALFGMVKLLKDEQHELNELPLIIVSFVLGFTFVVVGIVFIQKRKQGGTYEYCRSQQPAKGIPCLYAEGCFFFHRAGDNHRVYRAERSRKNNNDQIYPEFCPSGWR